ncbi:hypothetical protein [Nonomuraea sp. NPDC023979]|uniref:hypothetical protein n=1 Tax=Nonomuraea sp. NPDC023979 TaxID=3154796 RepID=UPI0033CB4FFA
MKRIIIATAVAFLTTILLGLLALNLGVFDDFGRLLALPGVLLGAATFLILDH